jgi:starch synthase
LQIVMLGSGHPHLEDAMRTAQEENPDFFRGIVMFSEPLAHLIMASADILLMPSRFEPCGLNQLHAMRYGTIPVAHATGGLQDTIQDVSPFPKDGAATGTGWTFSPATPRALLSAVSSAVQVYRKEPERWKRIQEEAMKMDYSWGRAASLYERVLRSTLAKVGYAKVNA